MPNPLNLGWVLKKSGAVMVGPESQSSFVARIWLEGGADGSAVWRGHVRDVHGDEECYFQNLYRLKIFLEGIADVPVPVGDEQ